MVKRALFKVVTDDLRLTSGRIRCNQTGTTPTASTTKGPEFLQFDAFMPSMSADTMMTQTMPADQLFELDPTFFDISSSSSTAQSVPALSANVLHGL